MNPQASTRTFQTAVVSNTGTDRPVPSYSLALEEIGEHAVNGASIAIHGCSRDDAVLWLRSAADALANGAKLKVRGFDAA